MTTNPQQQQTVKNRCNVCAKPLDADGYCMNTSCPIYVKQQVVKKLNADEGEE